MSSPGREGEQDGKWKGGRTDISKKRKKEVFQWKKCSNERGVDVNNSLKLTFENLLQIVILISHDL